MTTFTPPVEPSYGTSKDVVFRTLTNDFGDGYQQSTPDGINDKTDVWSVQWGNVTDADAMTLMNFFRSVGESTVFDWTTPENETKRFKAKEPKRGFVSFNNNNVSVTFTEDHGAG